MTRTFQFLTPVLASTATTPAIEGGEAVPKVEQHHFATIRDPTSTSGAVIPVEVPVTDAPETRVPKEVDDFLKMCDTKVDGTVKSVSSMLKKLLRPDQVGFNQYWKDLLGDISTEDWSAHELPEAQDWITKMLEQVRVRFHEQRKTEYKTCANQIANVQFNPSVTTLSTTGGFGKVSETVIVADELRTFCTKDGCNEYKFGEFEIVLADINDKFKKDESMKLDLKETWFQLNDKRQYCRTVDGKEVCQMLSKPEYLLILADGKKVEQEEVDNTWALLLQPPQFKVEYESKWFSRAELQAYFAKENEHREPGQPEKDWKATWQALTPVKKFWRGEAWTRTELEKECAILQEDIGKDDRNQVWDADHEWITEAKHILLPNQRVYVDHDTILKSEEDTYDLATSSEMKYMGVLVSRNPEEYKDQNVDTATWTVAIYPVLNPEAKLKQLYTITDLHESDLRSHVIPVPGSYEETHPEPTVEPSKEDTTPGAAPTVHVNPDGTRITRVGDPPKPGPKPEPASNSTNSSMCFSGSTLVQTPSGDRLMKELSVNDLIYTAVGIEKVLSFMHDGASANMIKITHENGEIEMSHSHNIFLSNGETIQAGKLKINDQLSSGRVLSIEEVTVDSFRAPLTHSGTISVGNTIASTYVTEYGVPHWLSHLATAPMRMFTWVGGKSVVPLAVVSSN